MGLKARSGAGEAMMGLLMVIIVFSLGIIVASVLIPTSGIAHRSMAGVADQSAAHNVAVALSAAAKYDPTITDAVAANGNATWTVPAIGVPGHSPAPIAIKASVVGSQVTIHAQGGSTSAEATTSVSQQAPPPSLTPQ